MLYLLTADLKTMIIQSITSLIFAAPIQNSVQILLKKKNGSKMLQWCLCYNLSLRHLKKMEFQGAPLLIMRGGGKERERGRGPYGFNSLAISSIYCKAVQITPSLDIHN